MFSFDTSTRMDQFPYTCTLVRDQILKLFCSRTLNMVCLFGISAPCLFDIIYSPRLHLVYAFVHLCLDVAMAPTPDLRGWRRVKWMRVKGLDPQLTSSNNGTSLSCFLHKQKYSYRVSRQAVTPCLERN